MLGREIVMASPSLDEAAYARNTSHLAVIDETAEGIRFVPMFSTNLGRLAYFRQLPAICRSLFGEIKQASVVHASPSQLYRPFEFLALMLGWALGKVTVSHTDIDNRQSAWMSYKSGLLRRRSYWTTRLSHNPAAHMQQLFCARACSLVLLKGERFAQDYGRGRSNVRAFLDSAYSTADIITSDNLQRKLKRVKDVTTPIDIVFFGRLVDYKGVDHMLRAIAHAKALGLSGFRFQIIGDGDARPKLVQLAEDLDLNDVVVFHGALAFEPAFFSLLAECHILLAAPLSQDTPRSALDAVASGQAIVAYDTCYYRELKAAGCGVEVVPWGDAAALGQRIVGLCHDRVHLAQLIADGVKFAHDNTQEIWLDRRTQWTRDAMAARPKQARLHTAGV